MLRNPAWKALRQMPLPRRVVLAEDFSVMVLPKRRRLRLTGPHRVTRVLS